ncbi:S-adenosyl-L-methionine-dependent methyltransferase [Lasiosphaeria hispida]|uniref:tRNA (guanine(26)-N(2))-dimethyltransferase n=1 Tax=Lasiosphaeria hispida TaxID=260671 RepID=A0AAJ0HIX2_9PEZI|nr:S-adenosyl-L-methionine-dependent methyltransferase [Lasiosphaeria hispida]
MASEAHSITASPASKQIIQHQGVRYTTVQEGLAYILVPEASSEEKEKSKDGQGVQQVFYNPIQQFNRDLTVLTIKAYGRERIERKEVASQSKWERIAERKRKKRKEVHHSDEPSERPAKSPKLSANTAAATSGGATNRTTDGTTGAPSGVEIREGDQLTEQSINIAVDDKAGAAKVESEISDKNQPKFTILDALSASGLRALRYAQEIPFVTSVTSNDLLKAAADAISLNVKHNGLESKIKVSHDDALAHMYTLISQELRRRDSNGRPTGRSQKYDVVDLDPYGTAAPFLDAAVQAVRDDGGLLCVTCTDSGVWASNGYPEKCYSLYGGVPVKGWFSHEVGLRLILHAIETSAAKYGLAMEPLLSLSIDFYSRVFVRIKKSPAAVKFQGGKNMVVYSCDSGCGAWTTQLLMRNKAVPNKNGSGIFYKHSFAQAPTAGRPCEHCGSTMHMAGPMYAGRIHSPPFVQQVLDELSEASTEVYGTTGRIRGMLQTALEENMPSPEELQAAEKQAELMESADRATEKALATASREEELAAVDPYPFYFHPGQLSGILRCATPPEASLKGALIGLGYRVTRSHCKPGSIKTDAPWSVIWHVMKEWIRQKAPIKEENVKVGSTGHRLLGLAKKAEDAKAAEQNEAMAVDAPDAAESGKPEVVFDETLARESDKRRLVRYQMNPRENWGPMNRAKGS